MPHEQPDDFVPLLAQQPSRHAAIDSARHCKDHSGHALIRPPRPRDRQGPKSNDTFRLSRRLGGEYNGLAELVAQEKHVMEHELVDRIEAIACIRKGLLSVQEGRTRPVEEVFEEIRREHEMPRSHYVGSQIGNQGSLPLD
jgi:predicted transcriptional regulator